MTHADHGRSPRTASLDVAVRQLDRDVVLVDIAGEVDLSTHRDIEAMLFDVLEPPSPKILIADLSEVSFFDASGISTLVHAHQRAQTVDTDLRVVSDRRTVRRPLTTTGVDRDLHLYNDPSAAHEVPSPPAPS
ncbi:MAG: anti-sigma factor antagonist [Streptosporangiales bacterium]|nr:anti-sigma factor antagonist [Streptosporangiales bacterium]